MAGNVVPLDENMDGVGGVRVIQLRPLVTCTIVSQNEQTETTLHSWLWRLCQCISNGQLITPL